MKSYDWILFDADNTLFDYDRAERDAFRAALDRVGIAFSEGLLARYHEINHACWRAYEDGAMTKEDLRVVRFVRFFDEIGEPVDAPSFAGFYLAQLARADYLIEGAREVLARLRRSCQLVLVTNGLKEVQRPRLRTSGLEPFFRAVVVSDEIGLSKPAAAFFQYTFEQIAHPGKDAVLMVGDNLNADIRGGYDFGLDTCWYNPRRTPNPGDVTPTYEIDRLSELPALLSPDF